jgi:hypothetical protein
VSPISADRGPGGSLAVAGRIALRPLDDPAWWDAHVAGHPDGTAFHLTGFLLTYARLFDLRPELAVVELDDEPVGVVPLLVRRWGPAALVNHGLGFPYLGPLLPDGMSVADVLPAIRRHLRPWPVARYTVRSVREQVPVHGPGWSSFPGLDSAVLTIPDPAVGDVTASFDRTQRRFLRRAERDGIVIGPATRDEIAEHMTAWANAPFLRQGRAPGWPDGAHLAVHDALTPSGVVDARAVRQGDTVVAMTLNLRLGERLIGWEMGVSDAGRRLGGSTLLAADGLRRGAGMGCTVFDLLTCPTPGIAAFKRSLGADLQPRGVAQWTSPAVRTMPWAQQAARRAMRTLARR